MGTLGGDQSKYKYCQVTQVLSGHTMMKVVIFCLVLVTFAAADFHVHVDEEDRTFCQLSTRNACAAACNGQACTEQCISSCGFLLQTFHLHLQCCSSLHLLLHCAHTYPGTFSSLSCGKCS